MHHHASTTQNQCVPCWTNYVMTQFLNYSKLFICFFVEWTISLTAVVTVTKPFLVTLWWDVWSFLAFDLRPTCTRNLFFASLYIHRTDPTCMMFYLLRLFQTCFCAGACEYILRPPASCWQCPHRKTHVRPVSPSLSLSVYCSLSLALFVSQLLHKSWLSFSALLSRSGLHKRSTLRHTDTHVSSHSDTHTHLSWSSCRNRGGEQRVDELWPKVLQPPSNCW